MSDKTPDLFLEMHLTGERPLQDLSQEDQQQLANLAASNDEVLRLVPPRVFKAQLETRRRTQRGQAWVLVGPVVAVATVFMLAVIPEAPGPQPQEPWGIREKGLSPHLQVHRVVGQHVEALQDGDIAHPKDVLQLSVVPGGAGFGAVVSVDGRGVVTVHHPRNAAQAAPLPENTLHLSDAYALDDAPAFERFFLVTAPEPFAVDRLVRAARDAGDAGVLPLFEESSQFTFLVRKAVP